MSIRSLYLFRHGETDWNVAWRMQGHTDIALNARGRQQAEELAERIRPYGVQALLSSDLARARETAEVVAQALGVSVQFDQRLRELALGDLEGMFVEDAIAQYGELAWQRWRSADAADLEYQYPNGESKSQARARIRAAIEHFLRVNPAYSCIGVATHGAILRTFLHSFLPAESPPLSIGNCALHLLQWDEGVDGVNWEYRPLPAGR